VCCSALQCEISRIHTWDMALLQCVAVCCSILQCVVVCCSVLQCVAMVRRNITYPYVHHDCVAVRCSALQCEISRIHTWDMAILQCIAVRCSVFCCDITHPYAQHDCVAVCCSVLQCVAVSCHVWQCVAGYGSIYHCEAVCYFRELTHPYAGHDSLISKNVHVTWLIYTNNPTRQYVGHDYRQPTIRLQATLSSHKQINRIYQSCLLVIQKKKMWINLLIETQWVVGRQNCRRTNK